MRTARTRSRGAPYVARGSGSRVFDTGIATEDTAQTILGGALRAWFVADYSDMVLHSNNVTRWKNRALTGDAEALYGVTPPTFDPEAFGGRGGVESDGTQRLFASISEIPAGSRPYIWAVFESDATELATSTIHTGIVGLSRAETVNSAIFARIIATGAARTFGAGAFIDALGAGGVAEAIDGLTEDSSPHLLEYGILSETTAKVRVDGVAYDGALTGATKHAMNSVNIFSTGTPPSGTVTATVSLLGRIREIVIAIEPTSDQLTSMRANLASRNGLSL